MEINESRLKQIIKESIKRVLNESFKSSKLEKVFNKHHHKPNILSDPHYNSTSDIYFNNMWSHVSEITDDMIDGIYDSPQEAHVTNKTPYMSFKNGTTVVFNDKIKKLEQNAGNKFLKRNNSQWWDREYKENYYSRNLHYNSFKRNYKGWNKDIENGDKPYFGYDKETRHQTTPSVVKKSQFNNAKDWYNKNKKK